MNTKLFILGSVFGVVLGLGPAWAQVAPSAVEELTPNPDETIDAFAGRAQKAAEDRTEDRIKGIKQAIETTTAKSISQKPTTATPPPAFADRVNATIADFLPWFQFAVNEITSSDDKMSVTAKFNPLPIGVYGNLSLTSTASQPQVFKALEERIVEPAREAQRKNLLDKVNDFSDLTFAVSYGFQRPAGTWANTRKLFGRNYELYRNLASDLLNEALRDLQDEIAQATDRISRTRRKIFAENISVLESVAMKAGLTRAQVGEIRLADLKASAPVVYDQLVNLLLQEAQISATVTTKTQKAIQDRKLDALPAMIDNQPQIVIQGSYRSSDDIIGPDAVAITANYEIGSRNFNAALREYHQMQREGNPTPSYLEAYRRAVTSRSYMNEDKLILSASFRRNADYNFTYNYKDSVAVPGSTTPVEISHTAALSLPRSDDWHASLTWTRLWPRNTEKPGTFISNLPTGLPQAPQITGRQDPRTTLSIEWVNSDQKAKINNIPLENDRFVARLSLVVPVQGGMTLPLTIVYSNKPEFLKGQDRFLSAHVGISYKIGDKGTASGQ
jgi:hypothetical protein